MDLTPDPLFIQVRKALRSALAEIPARSELYGAPVVDGASGPTRTVLDRLGAADFERPASAGGFDLGLTAGVLVSEELGRAACGNAYRAGAMAADAGCPTDVGLAGLEVLPIGGGGVTATPRAVGWELTGTATVDDPESALFLVVAMTTTAQPLTAAPLREAVLVAVPRDAPGVSVETRCWPPVVRFVTTPVAPAGVVGTFGDTLAGPLARARLRQAAYLLGIADGAHRVAAEHAGFRRQFGTRLRDLPAVSFPLARASVALRATRAAVYRGAWLVDSESEALDTAPVIALAMAAETARDVVRLSMQSCGVRAMTAELGLHRYFRLTTAESSRYGDPAALWRLVGAARLQSAGHTAVPDRTRVPVAAAGL